MVKRSNTYATRKLSPQFCIICGHELIYVNENVYRYKCPNCLKMWM